jgi:predicted RNase H-like nuclease (RuvC/YqgF family)
MTVEKEETPAGSDENAGGGIEPSSTPDGGDEKATRAERRAATFAKENKELKERLATLESADQKKEEELQRSRGEWEKLLQGRDSTIEDLRRQNAELSGTTSALNNQLRENEIITQLASAADLKVSQTKLRAAYRGLFGDAEDRYPDGEADLTKVAKEREKKLRETWSEFYGSTTTTGGSPSPTGATKPAKGGGEGFY